jgi:hypothetical protein
VSGFDSSEIPKSVNRDLRPSVHWGAGHELQGFLRWENRQ